jgi:hypothetical protein
MTLLLSLLCRNLELDSLVGSHKGVEFDIAELAGLVCFWRQS